MYSGYIPLASGKQLYYIFVESLNSPKDDPLVLWVNGGPGCSSLIGFFKEIGPIQIHDRSASPDGNLTKFTWTNNASIIFVDALAGTGFSEYAKDDDLKMDDFKYADDTKEFIKNWLNEFPDYNLKQFFLAGESYAGVMLPILAISILNEDKFPLSLRGVLMGNAVTEMEKFNSGVLEFLFGHQLYSLETRDILLKVCLKDPQSARCRFALDRIYEIAVEINEFDIKGECYKGTNQTKNDYANWWYQKLQTDRSRGIPEHSCLDFEGLEIYLNEEPVRAALNTNPPDPTKPWKFCNPKVQSLFTISEYGSASQIIELFNGTGRGIRMLLYTGDTDAIVPYTWTLQFLEDNFGAQTAPWQPWMVKNTEKLGGFTYKFSESQGLVFATVKGAGHLAPKNKAQAVNDLFLNFVQGKN